MAARVPLNLLKKIVTRVLTQNIPKTKLNNFVDLAQAKIITGSTENIFASQLAKLLNITLIGNCSKKFSNQEFTINFSDNLKNNVALIVQSTYKTIHDNLMELFFLANTAKSMGAKKVVAVIPYFYYARQEKKIGNLEFAPAEFIAKIFECSGIDSLITLDLHSPKIADFFNIPIFNIDTAELFANELKNKENCIIVSPDNGSTIRAKNISNILKTNTCIMHKNRITNDCSMKIITGNVAGKNCVIVDDIIDTGSTLCRTAELLINSGALSVEAIATHAILSANAIEKIQKSRIKKITITNSIHHKQLPNNFKIIDIANTFKSGIDYLFNA